MAQTITDVDLRDNCADILDALGSGQEFVITRDGRPVGELHAVPRHRESTIAEIEDRLARLPRNQSGKDFIAEIDAAFPF